MMKYIILTINAIFCLLLPTACSGSGETGGKTPETVALLQNLKQAERKGILFGHHDDTAYGIGWKEIRVVAMLKVSAVPIRG